MTDRIVARLTCDGCLLEDRFDISDIRVERGVVIFVCEFCGERQRKVTREEWEALAKVFDRPGGTMVSEREVTMFRLQARRFERHLEAEGLAVEA